MFSFRILPVTMAACSLFIVVKIAAIVDGTNRLSMASPAYAEEEKTAEKPAESADAEEKNKEEAKKDNSAAGDEAAAEKPSEDKKEGDKEKEDKKDKNKNVSDVKPGGLFDKCQFNQIEVDLLQSLSARREEIEKWADDVKMQENVLKATELQIDQKLAQMQNLKTEVQALLKKYDSKEAVELQSLVKIYENMKPKDAARIFNEMEMEILLELVDIMSERKASPILANMDPKKAKDVTIELAEKRRLKQRATAGVSPEAPEAGAN